MKKTGKIEAREYIYGVHPVLEILKCGKRKIFQVVVSISRKRKGIEEILQTCREQRIKVKRLPGQHITTILKFPNHQGVLAEVSVPEYMTQSEFLSTRQNIGRNSLYLFLDRVQDPRNFGGILRSAVAFGVDCVLIPENKSARLVADALKASAGLAERMPLVLVNNATACLEFFRKHDFTIVALEAHAERSLYEADMRRPLLCIIGGEDQGIRDAVKNHSDMVVSIPIAGDVNSISVSAAAAVFLAEINRQTGPMNRENAKRKEKLRSDIDNSK